LENLAPNAAEARLLHILDKSTFRKTDRRIASGHDVIEQAYVHQLQGGLQALSDDLVGLAWLRDSRRMIVGDDHSRGVGAGNS
jgi:hypothetical protein